MADEPTPTEEPTPPTPPSDSGPLPAKSDGRVFTEDEFKAEVERRLKSQKAAIESQIERDRKKADEAALAQQGEYQKLAEERAQRIADLEGQIAALADVTSMRDRFKGALGAVLAKEREGLAPHLIELLDGKDEADQLEWLARHRDELRPAATGPNGAHIPPTPSPSDSRALTEAEAARRRAQVAAHARRSL